MAAATRGGCNWRVAESGRRRPSHPAAALKLQGEDEPERPWRPIGGAVCAGNTQQG